MKPSSLHFWSSFQLILAFFIAHSPADIFGQSTDQTQRIFNQISHELALKNPLRKRNVPVLATGSCWALSLNGEQVLVTAAHNLGLAPNYNPEKIGNYVPGANCQLRSLTNEVIIGLLAYEPKEVARINLNLDLVLIRPLQPEVFNASRVITLAKQPPKQGDHVVVYGFPGQAIEKEIHAIVKVAVPGRNFIVLENLAFDENKGGIGHGVSGGVVLNAANEAVAMVITTGKGHFNALLVSEGLLNMVDKGDWKPFKEVQIRKF